MPAAYDAEGKVSQSKRYEVLTARYRDVEAEERQETPWAQQEQFEAEQIKKAITAVGARDRTAKGGGWAAAAGCCSCSCFPASAWEGWAYGKGSSRACAGQIVPLACRLFAGCGTQCAGLKCTCHADWGVDTVLLATSLLASNHGCVCCRGSTCSGAYWLLKHQNRGQHAGHWVPGQRVQLALLEPNLLPALLCLLCCRAVRLRV